MTPREYLEQVVDPNLAELKADYGNIRHALNLVHSIDALAAHIFDAAKTSFSAKWSDTDYRQDLAGRSTDFQLLRDIAKAIKHVELVFGKPLVDRGDQLSVRPVGWGEGGYGEGRYGGPPQAVVVTDDGKLRYIEQVAESALDLLKAEMATLGL